MKTVVATTLKISHLLGLHVHTAQQIVQTASQYDANLLLTRDGREIDGSSIMGVLLLAAGEKAEIEAEAIGPEPPQLIQALEKLFVQ